MNRCRVADWLKWAFLSVMAVVPSAAIAQTDTPAAGVDSHAVDGRAFLAEELTSLALIDLRAQAEPTREDAAAAGTLLSFAQMFAPNDAELVRQRLLAADAADDGELVESLTRQLIRLDPTDTVAQLRAIGHRVAREQTAEARIRLFETLLGQESIDVSVRSRLALDAALLHRELGDDEKYAELLVRSLRLDA
ncbi:MAG: hypothetical protein AAF747_10755, partial [Planctomycetota bacterium]